MYACTFLIRETSVLFVCLITSGQSAIFDGHFFFALSFIYSYVIYDYVVI